MIDTDEEAIGNYSDTVYSILEGTLIGAGLLIFWYLVYGPAGLTSSTQLGIVIPFLGVPIHHEVWGIFISSAGVGLLFSENAEAQKLGGLLIGIGSILFFDDLLQHCGFIGTGTPGTCTNWP